MFFEIVYKILHGHQQYMSSICFISLPILVLLVFLILAIWWYVVVSHWVFLKNYFEITLYLEKL